jgi:transglutaminase-like putative cysteine protease
MDRRHFLKSGLAAGVCAMAAPAWAGAVYAPGDGAWRRFEIVTRLALAGDKGSSGDKGRVEAWVPLPSFADAAWSRPLESRWTGNAEKAQVLRDPTYGARFLHLSWSERVENPNAEIVSQAETRDRAPAAHRVKLSAKERALYTAPTALIPTDGIVRETALKAAAGARSEEAKARALYEWVVENTYRKASTRGCGTGDIVAMLKSGDLGGKCADLNALYVGMARALGLPARDLYGVRVAASRFGYQALGPKTETITKAQHCRAEVYLSDTGWFAVDPADVRKVVLEEPESASLDADKTKAARAALFGATEGNWIAYNAAHDLTLPGAAGGRADFLMYPHAERAGLRLNCLDPDHFHYEIKAREIAI